MYSVILSHRNAEDRVINSNYEALNPKFRPKVEDLPQCENSRFNGTRETGHLLHYLFSQKLKELRKGYFEHLGLGVT